ncbi:MAG TPA: PepSY-associated TM helix domain-containing protein [Dyella sp.]|uniref:PepSY-associated TM helix domain-containing protein n=1 Tax=Dyella sp. TaxID=1869338 RepID=UPI002D78A614|nr:PepSY-associated TM helix domain-containing protein [Dyella sp.]HET6553144.1 PepSY-associated TM helix domain-containing protein [Dyella sp.]
MKSATLRTFQTVHTWTGLLAGFALFVAFYAGALTVFHDDIAAWQSPPWRSATDAHVSADALIERLLATHPAAKDDFGIVLPKDTSHAAYAYWMEGGEERFATASQMEAPTAEGSENELADFVYALHDSLGLPVIGLYLMGIVSVIYGLALLTGILIHLPQLFGDFFAMRVGRNLKRLWQDAHNAIGVLSLPFHVIFAVTGALFCLFTITLAALNTVAFDGKLFDAFAKATATTPTVVASGTPARMLSADELITRARAQALTAGVTSFDPDYMHFAHYGDHNAVAEVRGLSRHTLGTYGTVAMSARDGSVLATYVGDRYSFNGISYAALFGLHFGSFGGRAVQWLYFILGLAGAFLFYSGNLLYIESRRRRRHADQPMRTQVMARATIGVCIGSCLAISGAFAATWIAVRVGVEAGTPQRVACYGLFLAACAYACARPVARATVELLWATALLTILVAVVDLIGNAADITRAASPLGWSVVGVDLTGIALGLVFIAFARATKRRARRGDANSVWAWQPARG